jgi:hypothetical protein
MIVSGVADIAVGLSTPTLALFYATSARIGAPRPIACVDVYKIEGAGTLEQNGEQYAVKFVVFVNQTR